LDISSFSNEEKVIRATFRAKALTQRMEALRAGRRSRDWRKKETVICEMTVSFSG
jgi:hypothetical protein